MSEPFINQLRYRAARIMRKAANRLAQKNKTGNVAFPNLGAEHLSAGAPRALIIYNVSGIDRYVRGVPDADPFFNKHTIYWESVEMVRQLNALGYIVDYADYRVPFVGDWSKYAVVIDQWDNLKNAPDIPEQIRVFWPTFIHWLPWNTAELQRIQWFKERTGIVATTDRQLPCISSDEHCDWLTYFGTNMQVRSFSAKPKKFQIDISSCFVPEYKKKNIADARNKFLWLSGGGLIMKGIDIVVEAFARMPETELYMIRDLKEEPKVRDWVLPIIEKHPHIHHFDNMDLASPAFDAIADPCIGLLQADSSSGGGPGTAVRAIHNGLIPIVTPSALVRSEILGYNIVGNSAEALIQSTIDNVRTVMNLPDHELQERSDSVREFAKKYHTREAFSQSFAKFLDKIGIRGK